MDPDSEGVVEEAERQAEKPPPDSHAPVPEAVCCESPEALSCPSTISAQIFSEE